MSSMKVAVPYKNDISLEEEEYMLREVFKDLVEAGFPPECIRLTSDNLTVELDSEE